MTGTELGWEVQEVYPGFVISQLSWVVNDRHDGAGRESPDGQRSEGRAAMYPVL